MTNVPAPIIWFACSAILFIIYGLQAAHIQSIGFEEYVNELIKKHDFTPSQARKEAYHSFWFNWLIVIVSGVAGTAFFAQSISIMFKF